MIEQNWPRLGFVVHCDFCSTDEKVDTDNWDYMLMVIKNNGWTYFRGDSGDLWMHRCPTCSQVVRGS